MIEIKKLRLLNVFATKLKLSLYTGNEVVHYESPRPSMGIHRYIFVLFQQLGREAINAPDIIDSRQNFNTRDFARFHNLDLPVAAVYFNCNREGGTGGRRL